MPRRRREGFRHSRIGKEDDVDLQEDGTFSTAVFVGRQ